MTIKISETKAAVAYDFSEYLVKLLEAKNQIHIALSGGSTPKIVFDVLAKSFGSRMDWSKVHLYWGDERCVPPEDEESNYRMTVTHLISKIDIPQTNVHRILGEAEPKDEAMRYGTVLEKRLPQVNGVPQFDLVILGMGDDGHTASIFPYEIDLWDAGENCVVAQHPDSGQKRISITGKVINNATTVAFLVTGPSKAEKVQAIIEHGEDAVQYPATRVAPHSKDLHWFLDAAAAAKLTSENSAS